MNFLFDVTRRVRPEVIAVGLAHRYQRFDSTAEQPVDRSLVEFETRLNDGTHACTLTKGFQREQDLHPYTIRTCFRSIGRVFGCLRWDRRDPLMLNSSNSRRDTIRWRTGSLPASGSPLICTDS